MNIIDVMQVQETILETMTLKHWMFSRLDVCEMWRCLIAKLIIVTCSQFMFVYIHTFVLMHSSIAAEALKDSFACTA